MCEPVSIASGIAAVGGAVSSGRAARQGAENAAENARRQAIYNNERYNQAVEYQQELGKWQEERYNQFASSTQKSLTGQFAAMLERLDQQRRQSMEQTAAYDTSNQQGLSQLRAQRAGTGGGNSFRLAQQQYELAIARQKQTAYRNLDAQFRQSARDMLSMQAQAQSRVNAALPAPMAPIDPAQPVAQVQSPSMLPYLFQGLSGALGAAANSYRLKDPTPSTFNPTPSVSPPGFNPIGSGGGFA
tara:strand:+ start:1216 stop:1947 length:732 start_codon:yes stop_codon:yes gene_type:complete